MHIRQKYIAKDMREYNLLSCVIDGDTRLHDLGGFCDSYLSEIPFEKLYYGYTTECRLGMIFVTWCIVKLDFYITLCRAFHMPIVDNDIIHIGIKLSHVAGELVM